MKSNRLYIIILIIILSVSLPAGALPQAGAINATSITYNGSLELTSNTTVVIKGPPMPYWEGNNNITQTRIGTATINLTDLVIPLSINTQRYTLPATYNYHWAVAPATMSGTYVNSSGQRTPYWEGYQTSEGIINGSFPADFTVSVSPATDQFGYVIGYSITFWVMMPNLISSDQNDYLTILRTKQPIYYGNYQTVPVNESPYYWPYLNPQKDTLSTIFFTNSIEGEINLLHDNGGTHHYISIVYNNHTVTTGDTLRGQWGASQYGENELCDEALPFSMTRSCQANLNLTVQSFTVYPEPTPVVPEIPVIFVILSLATITGIVFLKRGFSDRLRT